MIRTNSRRISGWVDTGRTADSDIESIYLEGFGTLFLMRTNFSLLPPIDAKAEEPEKKAKDALWSEVRQNIINPPITQTRSSWGGFSDTLFSSGRGRSTVMEYSEESVNKLQGTLLATLVHASNMSRVGDNEMIVIHVTGAPQMLKTPPAPKVEPETVVADTAGGVVSGGIPPGAVTNVPRISRDARRAPVGKPTHMVIRAPMTYINDLADEQIDFEEFREKVSVVIY